MKKQHDHEISRIRVERATERDVEAMTALLGELFRVEHDFAPQPERQAAGLRLLLKRERAAGVFVARESSRVVGMTTAQLVVSTAEGGLSAWIEDVTVHA